MYTQQHTTILWAMRVFNFEKALYLQQGARVHRLLLGRTPRPQGETPYALTPHTVELIPTLGAFPPPRGGPVQDPVLTTLSHHA